MKPTKKVALCGIVTALSLVFMFVTGLFPIASYAIPAFCGILLILVLLEMGAKQALLVYLAVSLLSLIITPDREAAAIYILFLGYYPIVKAQIEKLHSRIVVVVCKLLLLAMAGSALMASMVFVFGLYQISWSIWLILGGAVAVIIVFFIYDLAVTLLADLYLHQIRPKYLKNFFD